MFQDRTPQRTDIATLGEFGLIDYLTKDIKPLHASTIKGIGDDAAVIKHGDSCMLISKDLLIEGVHFDMMYTPLKHLGYKAAVANFSDIAAMNALPKQILVGIAVSSKYPVEALKEIYDGIQLACTKYNVDLIGGDTTSSRSGLMISITVIGESKEEQITYRNTAQEHDLICVSGDLGAAYMGLQILEREKHVFTTNPDIQPDLEGMDYILERQLKPEARTDIVKFLHESSILPTSMIDISDGLASEILHICKSSDKGCALYEDKIPIDQLTYETARLFDLDPTVCALNGGEDYELLFTVKQTDFEKIKQSSDISIIGHITEKNTGNNLIAKNGTQFPLSAQGWDSLKNKD